MAGRNITLKLSHKGDVLYPIKVKAEPLFLLENSLYLDE